MHILGQSDIYENGSSGDNSDQDLMFDVQNSRKSELSVHQGRPNTTTHHQDKDNYHALWTNNSSRLVIFIFLVIQI